MHMSAVVARGSSRDLRAVSQSGGREFDPRAVHQLTGTRQGPTQPETERRRSNLAIGCRGLLAAAAVAASLLAGGVAQAGQGVSAAGAAPLTVGALVELLQAQPPETTVVVAIGRGRILAPVTVVPKMAQELPTPGYFVLHNDPTSTPVVVLVEQPRVVPDYGLEPVAEDDPRKGEMCEMSLEFDTGRHQGGGLYVRATYLNAQCGEDPPTFLEVTNSGAVTVTPTQADPFVAVVEGQAGQWEITARSGVNNGRAFLTVTLP